VGGPPFKENKVHTIVKIGIMFFLCLILSLYWPSSYFYGFIISTFLGVFAAIWAFCPKEEVLRVFMIFFSIYSTFILCYLLFSYLPKSLIIPFVFIFLVIFILYHYLSGGSRRV